MRRSTSGMAASARVGLLLAACVPLGGCFGRADLSDAEEVLDLLGILVSPSTVVVNVGGELQLSATGLLADRESRDLTDLADWESQNGSIARVSTDLDEEGMLKGLEPGTTNVLAEYQGVKSVAVEVIVTDADIDRLTVTPDDVDLSTGDTVQLSAEAVFEDGSHADFSTQVRWITGSGSVATVDSDGVLEAEGSGTTTVHAEYNGTSSNDVAVTVGGGSSGGSGSSKADLIVSGVSGSVSGGYVDLTVQVKNDGGKSASDFWVDVWVDPSSTPSVGDYGDDFDYVSYLGAGSSDSFTYQLSVSGSGSHDIYVLVDSLDAVDESSESNNSSSTSVSSSSSGGSSGSDSSEPDLLVSYFEYEVTGGEIFWDAEIENDGGDDAGHFYVDIFVDETTEPDIGSDGDAWESVDGLSSGATLDLSWYADYSDSWCWGCRSWLLVDSYDEVDEDNENNNTDNFYVYD